MSSLAPQSSTRSAKTRFSQTDKAFALAWEIYAPGLTGWTVLIETDDEGLDVILVDPPLAFDQGFTIQRQDDGVLVQWSGGEREAASVRDAMLLICPLAPDHLRAADALSEIPSVAV